MLISRSRYCQKSSTFTGCVKPIRCLSLCETSSATFGNHHNQVNKQLKRKKSQKTSKRKAKRSLSHWHRYSKLTMRMRTLRLIEPSTIRVGCSRHSKLTPSWCAPDSTTVERGILCSRKRPMSSSTWRMRSTKKVRLKQLKMLSECFQNLLLTEQTKFEF